MAGIAYWITGYCARTRDIPGISSWYTARYADRIRPDHGKLPGNHPGRHAAGQREEQGPVSEPVPGQPGPDEVQRILGSIFQGDSAPDFTSAAIEMIASAHVKWYRAWQAAGAPECRAAEWTGILIASLAGGGS